MSRMVDSQGMYGVEIAVSDLSEFLPLCGWLERVPAVKVERTPGTPRPGEQGAWDVLTIFAGSSGALAVAARSLPEFIRSRRSDLTITVKIDEKEFTLHAANVDEVASIID